MDYLDGTSGGGYVNVRDVQQNVRDMCRMCCHAFGLQSGSEEVMWCTRWYVMRSQWSRQAPLTRSGLSANVRDEDTMFGMRIQCFQDGRSAQMCFTGMTEDI